MYESQQVEGLWMHQNNGCQNEVSAHFYHSINRQSHNPRRYNLNNALNNAATEAALACHFAVLRTQLRSTRQLDGRMPLAGCVLSR